MPKVVRPWLTVGVAALGIGAIVAAPSSAPKGEVRIENSAIVQNETQGPLQYYPDVLSRSLANARRLVAEYLEDPLPVVRAVADNQHRAVTEVLRAAAELDPEAFAQAVLSAANQPVASLGRVVARGEPVRTANSLLVRLALPAASGVLAGGAGVADVVDAATDLDPVRVAGALVNLPARTMDGLLNGRVDGERDEYFGLLGAVVEAPVSDQISGPVDYLIDSLQDIGDTIAASSADADADALAHAAAPPGVASAAPAAVEEAPAPRPRTTRTQRRDTEVAAEDGDAPARDRSAENGASLSSDDPDHADPSDPSGTESTSRHPHRKHSPADTDGPSA
ncbi:hypothetical protein EUA04_07725 [Mycolicibacterium obuense]|uniref:Uncharacterized protein n=1 Tax=Mycolicibacterium obuense TaxID=1807 RepID=A0A4R5X822_9MYCO|nr:hypothetical protein [Mycolicibacterium obuense]TDL09839.1 hypothetical protein EUA04_07725 [Mycolicibacterium obuense]